MKKNQLAEIKSYVFQLFNNDATGHDFYHMERVSKLAIQIAREEHADIFLCEAAAWLHDVGDSKLFSDQEQARNEMNVFLTTISMSAAQISTINQIIDRVSFRKGLTPETIEGKIVQDADRLDAIGAIGIARTFAYGGTRDQLIYHPTDGNTSIQHFYDKLLKLKNGMNTETAKRIATERHAFMQNYLNQFYKEWDI